MQKVSPPMVAMFYDGSKFCGTILLNYCKIWQAVSEEKNFEEFHWSLHSEKSLSPTAAMFYCGSKFRKQFLKRVTQGTILWNNFKIWQAVSKEKNFKEFLWSPQSEKASWGWGGMFWRIKILRTNFEKGHTRNNLVKLFQILTSSFGEEDFF